MITAFFGVIISLWTIIVIYMAIRFEQDRAKQRRARQSLENLILGLKRKWQENGVKHD